MTKSVLDHASVGARYIDHWSLLISGAAARWPVMDTLNGHADRFYFACTITIHITHQRRTSCPPHREWIIIVGNCGHKEKLKLTFWVLFPRM